MFSIIIPVYNNAMSVERAIRSVLAQTESDFEVILVNDGSTDNSLSVLQRFISPRVRVFDQFNSGVAVARNSGIAQSQGKYLTFLDADDEWLPHHLSTLQMLVAQYPHAGFYSTSFQVRLLDGKSFESNRYLPSTPNTPAFVFSDFFSAIVRAGFALCHTNSVMVPRSVFAEVGNFEPGIMIGEDSDLWNRIALHYDVVVSREVTTVYHREESTATKSESINVDWPFFRHASEALAKGNLSVQKRAGLIAYMDRMHLSAARHLILRGLRWEGMQRLNTIQCKVSLFLPIMLTLVCACIPTRLILWGYLHKYQRFYTAVKTRVQ
jgi:glycosyltransferase involved in cell wall biosynthesis